MLEAGDDFQGSLFFTTYSGAAEAEMLNRIGLDAMVYGNHEFDLGPEPLAKFIEAADFPVLSGNVDVSADNLLAPLALKTTSCSTSAARRWRSSARPRPRPPRSPRPARRSTLPRSGRLSSPARSRRSQAEGVDKIIVLSHLGVHADIEVAEAVPGIDAIVGGHSHTLFSNTDADAPYKYPLMVDGPDGTPCRSSRPAPTPSTSATSTLTFDDAGKVTAATGDTILLDASGRPRTPASSPGSRSSPARSRS